MKKILFILILISSLSGCKQQINNQDLGENKLPRIAIAGLAIESSTFSPAQAHVEAFRTRRGDEVFNYYPFLSADSVDSCTSN